MEWYYRQDPSLVRYPLQYSVDQTIFWFDSTGNGMVVYIRFIMAMSALRDSLPVDNIVVSRRRSLIVVMTDFYQAWRNRVYPKHPMKKCQWSVCVPVSCSRGHLGLLVVSWSRDGVYEVEFVFHFFDRLPRRIAFQRPSFLRCG